ncbi:MAG: hypothetical protein RLZZ156_1789 [Deinococcota bacterium]
MKSIENLNTSNPSHKIARNIFIGFAGFNGLIALLIGVMTLVNMQGVFASLGVTYSSQLDTIGLTAGGLFSLVAILSGISILWLVQGKLEGILVPTGYATFLFVLGCMVLVWTGQPNVFYVDSIRGFLAMVAGYFAYQEMR